MMQAGFAIRPTFCFGYAAWRAEMRLADELAFADEGRDVVVVGVIDSLPAQVERGQRFEFAVESVQTAGAHVPARIALSWYGGQAAVVPAERWRFTVRLRRPHGNLNPGGFDLEAWMLERGLRASGVYTPSVHWRRLLPQVLAAGLALCVFLWWGAGQWSDWPEMPAAERAGRTAALVAGGAVVYFLALWATGARVGDFRGAKSR